MLSLMKLAVVAALGLLATPADAHAHLSSVRTSSGQTASANGHEPSAKNKIRHGIARNSNSGIPGVPSNFNCNWCVLEGTQKNNQRYSQWWSANPGAHTTNPNTWPSNPCMTYDAYGQRGTLTIRAGENITTSTFVNADHGGFYRFELAYDRGDNGEFRANAISPYYKISESNETPGYGYPGRVVGWGDGDLQQYIQRMSCVGVGCTPGSNIRDRPVSETWTFPGNVRKGPAVMRWIWSSLEGPEIYSSCVDLNIV